MILPTKYDPILMQQASDSVYFLLFYCSVSLFLAVFSLEDCVQAGSSITPADFAQYVELLKSCSAVVPDATVQGSNYRILNEHPISYFSPAPAVHHDICRVHHDSALSDLGKFDYRNAVEQAKYEEGILKPYVSACVKHSWVTPILYTSCTFTVCFMARAAYFAIRAIIN